MATAIEMRVGGAADADVIVIGSGPGGLAAGAYLAAAGRRVIVVEARDVVGGHQSAMVRSGFEFELGLHYVTADPVRELLAPVGIACEFTSYDRDAMFTLHFPDSRVPLPLGFAAMQDRLAAEFPAERQASRAFLTTIGALDRDMLSLQGGLRPRDLSRLPRTLGRLLRYARVTVGDYLDDLQVSPRLRTVLSWADGVFALPPSRLPLLGYASVVASYLTQGVAYPKGGSKRITSGLADVIRSHGGDVLVGTQATRILVEANRVRGVRTASGGREVELVAPVVVAAGDFKRTFLELLAPEAVPGRLLRRVRGLEMALPLAVVYLVVDRDLRAEGFPTTNPIAFSGDHGEAMYAAARGGEMPDGTVAHLWVGSIADPDNPDLCRPGQTNLQLIGVVPASHDFWGIVPGREPTPRYAERKRQVRDRLMAQADRVIPHLSESIVFEEMSTPVTDERYMLTTGGTSYGIALTPEQMLQRPGPVTPISGLFLAGAGTRSMHGLVGCLTGGVAAAAAILGSPPARLLGPLARPHLAAAPVR